MSLVSMSTVSRSALLASLIMASACSTFVREPGEEKIAAQESLPDMPAAWKVADAKVGEVAGGWVSNYNDPILLALVNEGQEQNRNLRALATRIDQAWALAQKSGAAGRPQIGAGVSGSGGGNFDGAASGELQFGVQASWEIDLWGRIKSGRMGAEESARAIEADVRFARESLALSIATAYFSAVEAHRQVEVVSGNIEDLTEIARITSVRGEHGRANAQDIGFAKSDLASARADLEGLKVAERDALRALEILVGRYPSAEIETAAGLVEPPPPPPAGLPSELLERRPDLVAAERRVASSIDFVNQARAAKLPTFSLTGSAGVGSTDLTDILNPANLLWQAASNILVPLTSGGALDADIDAAKADQLQAVELYAQTALDAFKDVESSLDASTSLVRRLAETTEALAEGRKALDTARLRYDSGLTDLLSVLTVQQRVRGLESSYLTIKRERLVNYGTLNLALGGNWE